MTAGVAEVFSRVGGEEPGVVVLLDRGLRANARSWEGAEGAEVSLLACRAGRSCWSGFCRTARA